MTFLRIDASSRYSGKRKELKQVAAVGSSFDAIRAVFVIAKDGFSVRNPPTGSREHPVVNLMGETKVLGWDGRASRREG